MCRKDIWEQEQYLRRKKRDQERGNKLFVLPWFRRLCFRLVLLMRHVCMWALSFLVLAKALKRGKTHSHAPLCWRVRLLLALSQASRHRCRQHDHRDVYDSWRTSTLLTFDAHTPDSSHSSLCVHPLLYTSLEMKKEKKEEGKRGGRGRVWGSLRWTVTQTEAWQLHKHEAIEKRTEMRCS